MAGLIPDNSQPSSGLTVAQPPNWGSALQIFGAMLQDIANRGRTNHVQTVSQALLARDKQQQDDADYRQAATSLLGSPTTDNAIPITPRVPTMPTGMLDLVQGQANGTKFSSPQEIQDYFRARDALNAASAHADTAAQDAVNSPITYRGGRLSGMPGAEAMAPILANLGPDRGYPALLQYVNKVAGPKNPIIGHPGDTFLDPTTLKPLASVPREQARDLTPEERTRYGLPAGLPAQIMPDGKISVLSVPGMQPPSGYRAGANGNFEAIPGGPADPKVLAANAGAEALARLNAQNSGLGVGVSGGAPASKLTGEDFLKTLAPGAALQVKALAEGRMQFPGGFAQRSPYWQGLLQAVSQYDPSFDAVNYNARSKTRNAFTSGTPAQNITAINTAIGHLGKLYGEIGGTYGMSGFPGATTLNAGLNAVAESAGSTGITNFKQDATALASELTRVWRMSGGAEADIDRYLQQLSPNATTEQKQSAVKNIVGLLQSRLDQLTNQYSQGMGTTAYPLQFLNPQSQELIAKITGQPMAGMTVPGQGVQAQPKAGEAGGPRIRTYNPQTGRLE
jgi:hypothetical protein